MEKAVYRILDANFNRAREALRVMEEYCRFVLNHPALSGRVKGLRHSLSQAAAALDQGRLLCARDSQGDVGKDLRIDGQMRRQSLEDCFVAAAKRLTEALRALAEAGQTIHQDLYNTFERLRFETYTLEKDISQFAFGYLRYKDVRLYILITANSPEDSSRIEALTSACIDGGADCIQLRCKGLNDKTNLLFAEQFTTQCRAASVLSIINDRADIAILSGADGVHLGQDDLRIEQVRNLQSRPLIVGFSTHNLTQLQNALSRPCDYVALGPVFTTATKAREPAVGIGYIKEAMPLLRTSPIGHVAIGGITLDNANLLLDAGVRTLAVCSAVCDAAKPADACSAFKKIIKSYQQTYSA